jgi:hypothetical protein
MRWSSYHNGLDRYYQRLRTHGKLKQPFPISHLKHYPTDGWDLGHGLLSSYIPYEVQPEQSLLNLSEADLYQQLLRLVEEFNNAPADPAITTENSPREIYDVKSYIGHTI